MPFDPSKSFEIVEEPKPSGFDPSKPFTVIKASGFDPGKPFEIVEEPTTPTERPAIPSPGETTPTVSRQVLPGPAQAFPVQGQAMADETTLPPRIGTAGLQTQDEALSAGVRQEPPTPEAEIQPIGKEGTVLRGASSAVAGILNRPEYLAAMMNPATMAAVGIRFAPPVAKQFFEDIDKAAKGDNEALGRAAVIGIPALIGGVRAGRTLTERMAAQEALERAQSASSASHIDALARMEAQPGRPTVLPPMAGLPIRTEAAAGRPSVLTPKARELTPTEAEDVFQLGKATEESNQLLTRSAEELSKLPEERTPDAIQERTTETLPVEVPPGDRREVGAQVREQARQDDAAAKETAQDVSRDVKEVIPSEEKVQEKGKEVLTPSTAEPVGGKEVKPTAETPLTLPPEQATPETPSVAAAKVESEVQSVAKEEGKRPAKEIKNELVDRIERAIDIAPLEADVKAKSYTTADMKRHETPDQAETVEINIPGDGNFKIRNTKEALGEILKRAKKISTDVTPKMVISKAAIKSSEEALRKSQGAKEIETAKDLVVQKEKARASLYDSINQSNEEGMVGSSQPEPDPSSEGTKFTEWRIRHATEAERADYWKRTKTELRWVGERRSVKFSPEKGRTEGEWLFDDSGKSRADVIRGMEANMPRDATFTDSGAKAWHDFETESGGYSFLKGPGIVGMGAATPSEFTSPESVVSNMFAAIDRDRAAMGKPPMEPGTPRTWDEDQQTAMAKMNRDPQWIPDLIKEVLAKPRPLLSWENAGMVLQKAYWKAEANNALSRIARAFDDGREADLVQAKADAARFEDNLVEMEKAVGRGGTGSEAGRTLQAQKMGLTDDLTMVEMRLEMRGKVGGRKLTQSESDQIAKLHAQHEAAIKAIGEKLTAAEKASLEAQTRATLAEIGRQAAEAKVPPPHIQRIVERVGGVIHKSAEEARARLKGKLFTIGDPAVLLDLAKIGADNIWTIGEDFARWSVKMAEDIGEHVKPHLQQIWEASKRFIDETVDAEAGIKRAKQTFSEAKTAKAARNAIKKGDTPQQQKEKLTTRIQDRLKEGKGESITPLVQKLARAFVESGVHEREPLIDAVHEVLERIMPGWTRRQTMDAISGYGDYKNLSKDEISLRLRDLKGQMQQIAKLEDMAARKAPLRTGLERREPTPAETQLIKLVNEAKRKGGYETTDPEKQLRTALDEVKKKTRTMISEYERRIAEEDFTVRKLPPIKPDSELIRLQADQKRIRQRWEQLKREKELANRKPWQKTLDRFVRWERAFKLSSPVVFGKLTAAAITRVVTTTAEEVTGAGLGLIPGIRAVAKQAPREGGINVPAMAKSLTEAVTKGMSDAWQTARKGAADIDVTYGEKILDKDWANVFGQLHGMLKAPVKRAEFTLSLEKRIAFNIKNGVDVTDPMVMTRLMTEALSDGYRSIFMQRGFSSDMFNTFVGILEKSKKYPVAGEISARVARFLMPVVRVPANIVAETATGIYGAPLASARTMTHAIQGTLKTLDPVVADSIMRQFKKGSIGLGLIAIGYFNPQMIGGYDWREKRPTGAVKTGGFQVGGTDIPRWATHAPWFELMQFGATIRHVKDQHVKGEPKGISEGMWAASLGLIEETPFVGNMLRVDKLFGNQSERDRYLGELTRGTLIPQAVQSIAQWTDTAEARKPKGFMQNVEMGIPGFRQNVPVKPPAKGAGVYP